MLNWQNIYIYIRVKRLRLENLSFLPDNKQKKEKIGKPELHIFVFRGIKTIYLYHFFW